MPTHTIPSLINECRNTLATAGNAGAEKKTTLAFLSSRLDAIANGWNAAGTNATDAQNAYEKHSSRDLKLC